MIKKWRLSRFALLFAILAAIVLPWADFGTFRIWDGGYPFTIYVSSQVGPLRVVQCAVYSQRPAAEEGVKYYLQVDRPRRYVVADPFRGEPITIDVPVSGKDSCLGFEIRRSQFKALAVVAETADGRWLTKVVDIPDGRESREVTVELP